MRAVTLACVFALTGVVLAQSRGKTLDIYTIDVEGGKSVLFVSPAGESMLVDVGWPKSATRDASTDQIVDAVRAAGVKQIDYLVLSHFDVDHMGDVPALAQRIPITHLVDHGEIALPPGVTTIPERFTAYTALRRTLDHRVVTPGDRIPLNGVDVEIVTAGGRQLSRPLKGAGTPNSLCATNPQAAVIERDVEDNQSIGVLVTYGRFRFLDLADLEAHPSHNLVCPNNLIGAVDVYHANVHAQLKGMAPELMGALRPTVALVGNGARKGGDPESWPILRKTPGLTDIWQVHYSEAGTAETNPPADFIANPPGTPDEHKLIKLSVPATGPYTITNTRNGFTKTYQVH